MNKIKTNTLEIEFLTVAEVCALLRISRPTLHQLTKSKTIPSVKIGGSIRYQKRQLIEYLTNNQNI